MNELTFRVVGIPKGQPRARAFSRNGHAGVYDPGTADGWKFLIRTEALRRFGEQKLVTFEMPIAADFVFVFPRPKSHYRSNGQLKPFAPRWMTAKPDRDNLDKAVLDALVNAAILIDDKIVVAGSIEKRYAAEGQPPGLSAVLREVPL